MLLAGSSQLNRNANLGLFLIHIKFTVGRKPSRAQFTINAHGSTLPRLLHSYSPYRTVSCIQIQHLQRPMLCVSIEHTCARMYLKQCGIPVASLLGNSAKHLSSLSKHLSNVALHKERWGFCLWLICLFLFVYYNPGQMIPASLRSKTICL